jgi:hypothetical protein
MEPGGKAFTSTLPFLAAGRHIGPGPLLYVSFAIPPARYAATIPLGPEALL